MGLEQNVQTAALAWNPQWRCCKASWWRLGTGARLTYVRAQNLELETAELGLINASQTSSLTVPNPQLLALNGFISAEIEPASWLRLGFNLDLVGLSTGPTQKASYSEAGFASEPLVQATTGNLFLIALRDIGTLNSEFFVGIPLGARWNLRLGLAHVFAEMTSQSPLKHGGERFRTIRNSLLLSVAYRVP